ncbi:hypothetical protein M433DRAFT_134694 [Acidomyces richmondensis BFW]|nr:MAG: hypothetical protein FE78DRAFT_79595 [Acidomyces sp. 'richmondensis']KYG45462.1 hypothetical protein M433DRAFT_134694 [Acidomyces richmondensis BFW]
MYEDVRVRSLYVLWTPVRARCTGRERLAQAGSIWLKRVSLIMACVASLRWNASPLLATSDGRPCSAGWRERDQCWSGKMLYMTNSSSANLGKIFVRCCVSIAASKCARGRLVCHSPQANTTYGGRVSYRKGFEETWRPLMPARGIASHV